MARTTKLRHDKACVLPRVIEQELVQGLDAAQPRLTADVRTLIVEAERLTVGAGMVGRGVVGRGAVGRGVVGRGVVGRGVVGSTGPRVTWRRSILCLIGTNTPFMQSSLNSWAAFLHSSIPLSMTHPR